MAFCAAMNERVYNGYPVAAQQKCPAHMRRHFLRLIKCPGQDHAAIGEVFVDLIDDVFDNYSSTDSLTRYHGIYTLGLWVEI